MMWFWWILIVVLIAAAVWWLARRGRAAGPTAAPDRSESILRERFARGEIDEETYRRQMSELRRPNG